MTSKSSNLIEPTYKVNYIKNGITDTIYVFKKVPEENKNNIFTAEELEIIQKNNTKIIYSNETIHMDDTIGQIKIKILKEIQKNISLEEIYLFCHKLETFHSISLFQTLTQNKKINLTNIRLTQFLSNIISDEKGNPYVPDVTLNKDIYDYDDILEMKIDNQKLIVNKVLGQKFFIVENEYPYVVNPYDVNAYDSFLERNSRKSLTTLNSHLLLNSGDLVNNNIYFCLAEDVLRFGETRNIPENLTLKIYFPFLYEKNINNLEDLEAKKKSLIENDKKYINENTMDYFNTINMFYDIYDLRKNELNYLNKGIKNIKAIIKPIYKINLPLEIIFKLLHANLNNPLIKYNPSSRQENIYRLFTDKIATDGRKIPYLKKAMIFKLMKNIGKTKSVSVFINNTQNANINQLVCDLHENGFITISCDLENALGIAEINTLLVQNVNPIIQEINNFLEQSGYKLFFYEDLYHPNIEIKQLTYECNIKIKQAINLESYKGCISSVFINESSFFKKNIHLRFKRVANFNKVTSIEAFILEQNSNGLRREEIIDAIVENFPDEIEMEEASRFVDKVVNEIQVEKGVKNIEIKVKDNPGFKTILELDAKTAILTIRVENINDIYYLSTIPIYLDSILRITQDKKSTAFPIKKMNEICSSDEKLEVKMNDIISPVESQLSELEIPSISEDMEDVEYTKLSDSSKSYKSDIGEERPKNAFDLFFDQEEGSEEESEPSIESLTSLKSLESLESDKSIGGNNKFILQNAGNDSEEDQPETDESESEEDNEENKENEVMNIDNLILKKKEPYFQTRIEKLDPALIIKEDTKEFNSYVRTCSSTMKRHPVILTNEELDNINKEYPGFLRKEDVIRYGSDPNKQYNYICPRYWCLKNNTIVDPDELTEVIVNGKKELKSKNCGYVLPQDAKAVKPGFYVYEFYKPKSGKKDYKRYPGFQVDKHPKGFCLPCCFDKYNTEGRITAKQKCEQKMVPPEKLGESDLETTKLITEVDEKEGERQPPVERERQIKPKEKKEDEYIIGPDKFPILPGRWAYLPIKIQQILHENNANCQISKTNTNLKLDYPCLLRHGVEINDKQSFIACISDVLFYGVKNAKVLSIKDMKNRIIDALNIDNFITYQNGNLVNDFKNVVANTHMDTPMDNKINEKYNASKLYSKINPSNEEERIYYNNVTSAFENFIQYLRDDDAIIDYTYLWDIISSSNKLLFPNGVNLIILRIPNDDITNNVELVCPSNHYSNEFYESRKPTIILIQEDNYFEPIYSYTNTSKKIQVIKEFKEYDPHLSKSLRVIFREFIKPAYNHFCRPLSSLPNIYKAKRPLLLFQLLQKLDKYDYKVQKFVMNFNNKIIGVIAESPLIAKQSGFIPCYPSSLSENKKMADDLESESKIEVIFMNNLSIWKTYEETFDFLMTLYKRSIHKKTNIAEIPCKPMLKVMEDELIVGLLTETNQFIQISQPITESDIKKEHDLPSIKNTSYVVKDANKDKMSGIPSDSIITTSNKVDFERVDYIKKITYETKFYNIFRNTIKILLNDYKYVKWREQIENELLKEYIIYTQKLNKIVTLLKELTKNKIQFIGDENYYKLIDEFTSCVLKDKTSCEKNMNLCMFTEKDGCNLILPRKNLITLKDNEEKYFGKMADELIRYTRIRSYILQPQSFLSFDNIGYNLQDNEIIMLQSLLTQDYFETLEPAIINKYVKNNSYDETEPILSQTYDNNFESMKIKSEMEKETSFECNKKTNNKITSAIWSECFPKDFKEIEYDKTSYCTFECIIDIIKKYSNETLEINRIKNILYEEYKKYIKDYSDKILDILVVEGKKKLVDQVKSGLISFSDFIYSDNYFLSTLDMWILFNKYNIPAIFISSKFILQTNYNSNIFVGFGNVKDKFCFIVTPGYKTDNIPGFKIIESNKGEIFVSLDEIKNEECKEKITTAILNKTSLDDYFGNFEKKLISKTKTPKKIIIVEDDSSSSEKEEIIIKPNISTRKKIIEKTKQVTKTNKPTTTKGKTRKAKDL